MTETKKEVFSTFGFEWDVASIRKGEDRVSKALEGIGSRFEDVQKSIEKSPIASTLIAITERIIEFANAFEEAAGKIEDASNQLGITTDQLQELNYAAEQGGVGAEQLNAALGHLQLNAANAAKGGGSATEAFRSLHIQLKNQDGSIRSVSDLMDDAARSIGGIEDPARRTQLATQLFGESGRRLVPILKEGEGGLAAWRKEFGELGGGLSSESIEAAGAYGDEVNRLHVTLDSLRSTVATAILPIVRQFAEWMTKATAAIVKVVQQSNLMKAAVVVLGVVMAAAGAAVAVAWLPVILPFVGIAAAIAAVVLVVDDLITLFEGGESAIGRFIDSLFGVGSSKVYVDDLKFAWELVVKAIDSASEAVKPFIDDLKFAGRALGIVSDSVPTSSGGATATPANTATIARPALAQTRVTQTNAVQVHVSGAGDPAAVAQEVQRRVRAESVTALQNALAARSGRAGG